MVQGNELAIAIVVLESFSVNKKHSIFCYAIAAISGCVFKCMMQLGTGVLHLGVPGTRVLLRRY